MSPQHDKLEAELARFARRVSEYGFETLEPREQVALVAYSAHSVVSNGGFKSFFEGPFSLTSLVSALRELKLNALANAALATAAAFPNPAVADDAAARREHLAALDTAKQDYVFFRLSSEELLDAILSYWKRQAAQASHKSGSARP